MAKSAVLGYEAAIEDEWLPLSDQHKRYLEQICAYIEELSKGNTDIPRLAIVGPYGQGKTQLLFHIMKLIFKNGGVAVYTHADRIVKLIETKCGPDGAILPSDLPELVREGILADLKHLNKQDELLLVKEPEILNYLRKHVTDESSPKFSVILIDEMEQAYELLQRRVKTDDKNPIRSLLDSGKIYTILAFAPRSIYEYKLGAAFGEGEAERSRLDTLYLPPVSSQEIKRFLDVPDKGFANFLWWVSRGRARFLIKARQQSQNYSIRQQRGFQSFAEAMGNISGVPCFDLDAIIDKSGKFVSNWSEVLNLAPTVTSEDKDRALLFKVEGDFDRKAAEFFGKLGFSGTHSLSLATYFYFLLDAVSGEDGQAVIKKKDALALLRATYELTLEYTFHEKLISRLQEELDKLQGQPDLRYSLSDMMEEADVAESMKPSKVLCFDFEKLLDFFPFPLSSPQLPGAVKEDVNKWLSGLPDLPLAEDQESSTVVLFFKDFAHLKQYCENEKHSFIEKVFPEKVRTSILLLQGEVSSKDLPAITRWLQNQERLSIKKLRPSLLADFLANALYLLEPNLRQPQPQLRSQLEILRKRFEDKNDRATTGKIFRYASALNELVCSLPTELAGSITSFKYERKGVAFEGEFSRQQGTEAFPYPFTIAFFDRDTEGLRALAQIRNLAERTGKPLFDFLPERGGYRTAVRFLPTINRKGVPEHNDSVEAVRLQYGGKITHLEELTGFVSKDEIANLVEDDLTKYLLQSCHEAYRFGPIAQGEKKRVQEYLEGALQIQSNITGYEKTLKAGIGIGFEGSLKFSPEQVQKLQELLGTVEKAESWRSPVYQRVFFVFAEQLAIGIKEAADEFWKILNNLPPEEFRDLNELHLLFSCLDGMPEEVFKYLGLTRDKLSNELNKKRPDIQKELQSKGIEGLGPANIRQVHEHFDELIDLKVHLENVEATISPMKDAMLERYRKLRRT